MDNKELTFCVKCPLSQSVPPFSLCGFYQSFIQSLLCFSFICGFNSLTLLIIQLESVLKSQQQQRDLTSFWNKLILQTLTTQVSSGHVLKCLSLCCLQDVTRFQFSKTDFCLLNSQFSLFNGVLFISFSHILRLIIFLIFVLSMFFL